MIPSNLDPSEVKSNLLAEFSEDFTVEYRITSLQKERGLSRADLSRLTGISESLLYSYSTVPPRVNMSLENIYILMLALRVTDINKLIRIEFSNRARKRFSKEARLWKENKQVPKSVMQHLLDGKE